MILPWKFPSIVFCSMVRMGWRNRRRAVTCLPEAWIMLCCETVKMTSVARWRTRAGSVQVDSFSSKPCLWQRIRVLNQKKRSFIIFPYTFLHHIQLPILLLVDLLQRKRALFHNLLGGRYKIRHIASAKALVENGQAGLVIWAYKKWIFPFFIFLNNFKWKK